MSAMRASRTWCCASCAHAVAFSARPHHAPASPTLSVGAPHSGTKRWPRSILRIRPQSSRAVRCVYVRRMRHRPRDFVCAFGRRSRTWRHLCRQRQAGQPLHPEHAAQALRRRHPVRPHHRAPRGLYIILLSATVKAFDRLSCVEKNLGPVGTSCRCLAGLKPLPSMPYVYMCRRWCALQCYVP